MIRERIADDIYVFTSKRYAQVTCAVILTKEGAILIDTLFYPDEAKSVRDFIEKRLGYQIKYVINTHYHADHTNGTYLYPQATIVSHSLCRQLLDTVGRQGLEQTKSQMPEFAGVSIVLPSLTLSTGTLDITIGGKILRLIHTPGHSEDLIGVYMLNARILFAADTMMPVPTFFDGSYDQLVASLHQISELQPDTVVQGHGEVILRGEVQNTIHDHLDYLAKLKDEVEQVIEEGLPRESLEHISIESCGKSRIPLNGLVVDLHNANLERYYDLLIEKKPKVALNGHQS